MLYCSYVSLRNVLSRTGTDVIYCCRTARYTRPTQCTAVEFDNVTFFIHAFHGTTLLKSPCSSCPSASERVGCWDILAQGLVNNVETGSSFDMYDVLFGDSDMDE